MRIQSEPRFKLLSIASAVIFLLSVNNVGNAAQGLPNFADLVENNAPSIVEISTTRRVANRNAIGDGEIEELLRRINP